MNLSDLCEGVIWPAMTDRLTTTDLEASSDSNNCEVK